MGLRLLKGLGFFILICLVLYFVLSRTTRYAIDTTLEVIPPSSVKSQASTYAFGYQPELEYSEVRTPCKSRDPLKQAYFGDLHVHTALSADAFPDGTRTFPEDAYRFAKGEAVSVPSRPEDTPLTLQLARPLDFLSVTDHAEAFGEGHICRNEGAYAGYEAKACNIFRDGGTRGVRIFSSEMGKMRPNRNKSVCGEDDVDCLKADKIVWNDVIRAAEEAYDVSGDCQFTSFVGYEYTRSTNAAHVHRNIIFKNADVPEFPASYFKSPSVPDLLNSLEVNCRQNLESCDVISIPHNSNISGGNSFNPNELDGFPDHAQQAYRAQRQSFERLVEIFQHKGSSECLNGVSDILGDPDELCDVEAIRGIGEPARAVDISTYIPRLYDVESEECSDVHRDPKDNVYKDFCVSSRDFVRGALLEGMVQEAAHGINPYEVGVIASTDTHIAAAGQTEEAGWGGHIAYETNLEGRLGDAKLGRFNRLISNPGGLAGVWAVENSRDAIFQSMKRREAFGTSGPRIKPRFFAGQYAPDMCEAPNWLDTAYEVGTPMGSKIPAQTEPVQFLLWAERDDRSFPLEKLQLIKGWIDKDGRKHNQVIDVVAGEKSNELCAVYEDPNYDPDLRTYYYMRVVEVESQRWSHMQCESVSEDERPETCDNDQSDTIHEMAWTSPIWLNPN